MKIHSLLIFFLFLLSINALFAQSTWHEIESNTDKQLLCIDFINDHVGYIGGYETLLKTTDGGVNWNAVPVDSITFNGLGQWSVHDIQFFTEQHGRVMLHEWSGIGMRETFDGGLTWSSMTPAHAGFCRFGALYFFDEDNGFAGGGGCFEGGIIDKMSTGVWATINYPTEINEDLIVNFDFFNADLGLACSDENRILLTTDGGYNWESVTHPESEAQFTDVAFLSADTAYATFSRPGGFGVLISIDGGQTFDVDWETATFFYPSMNAVHINQSGTPFMAGMSGNGDSLGVAFSKAGISWNYDSVQLPIQDIDSYGDSITFLVGNNGAIYVNVNPLTLSVNELDFSLDFSAYPNPATTHIRINLDQKWGAIKGIKILNKLGQNLSAIIQTKGQNSTIEIGHLEAGDYFIELITGQHRGLKRFVKL